MAKSRKSSKSPTKPKNTTTSPDTDIDSHRAHWTIHDEAELIAFLELHRAEAGDGMNFKGRTWSAAAIELKPHTTKGGEKTGLACKNKWQRVRFISLLSFLGAC